MSHPHDSAHTHVTGHSEFIDDRRRAHGELYVGIVYSKEAHAEITKLDFSQTLKVPGVVGVVTSEDVAHNHWGTIFQDQPLLAEKEVWYAGESIALVAASNKSALVKGIQSAKIHYKKKTPILSIQEARRLKSFIGNERKIERGDFETNFKSSPHNLSGNIVIQGQDHFYLESQAAIAYPKESGQFEIHSSSQHPTETQHVVAHALGIESKDTVCIVKRMGGAFGGKESQAAPIAAYAALAAKKFRAPSRIILTKDDDMIITGKRNPFENEYRVGFDSNGKILALEVNLYSDGGAYADLSTAIMERAMLHSDNAYYIPHVRITGQVCRTHYHPHTAFRGFGGPKGVATIERILEEIAHFLKKDALEIRKLNCYKPGEDITPYGQQIENNCLPELFSRIEKDSDYKKKRAEIEKHNRSDAKTIKGLAVTAVKFGISFTTRFLNQANALVVIHRDGSIQISTGATEMGQGVNTRIAQVVAEELGLSMQKVRVMPTSTEKNANTSPTAASSGTDLNASAAVIAARKIKSRLSQLALHLLPLGQEKWAKTGAPLGTVSEVEVNNHAYDSLDPNEAADWESGTATFNGIIFKNGEIFEESAPLKKITFEQLVNEAYLNRISLSEYAHYKIPGLSFNKLTGEGNAFFYFTQGVAASSVTISKDTGEVKVDSVDLLMDLGRPINHGLDVGQVTGGFIQGMGWVTTENLFYSKEGLLLSHSPSTYKIPSIQDIPRVFNVNLLDNPNNKKSIRGAKAVGEPPLLLGISVWMAIQDALKHLPPYKESFPRLRLPATSEVVLRAISPERFKFWDSKK